MEVKKSPKVSLENRKSLYLLMGIVMVLALIYIGFEWTNREVVIYDDFDSEVLVDEEIDIVQTMPDTPPPPPPPAPEVVEEIIVVEDDKDVTPVEIDTEDNKEDVVNFQNTDNMSFGPVGGTGDYDDDHIFAVVEKSPSFPGGEQALYAYLKKNMKYPVFAQENGIQGTVVCQFTVNRDGSIVDVVVLRSVDPSLDKEAIRVIQSMPKWLPGEQRNKPVRVKFTLPVSFRLSS